MKFTKIFLFGILLFLLTTALDGQTLFHKLYNQEASVEVLIEQASNGDVFMVTDSYNDTAAFFHRILVQRVNSDGDILQSSGLSKGGYSYRIRNILGTSDNGLLITGYSAEPLSSEDSVFVVKLDANGATSWSKGFQFDTDIHDVQGILETSDGGVIVYGIFERFATFESAVFMVKFNTDGELVWSREISSQLSGAFLLVGGLIETNSGELRMSGSTRFNTEGSWIAGLEASGILQAVMFYDTHKLTDSQPEPFAMFQRSNGELDLFYNSTSFQDGSILLNLRTDASGTPIQTNRYYLNHVNGGEITFVRPNGSGGYLMSGYHFPDGIRSRGLAMEIDGNDAIKWRGNYGTDYIEILTGIVPSSDGGFLLGGFADPEMVIVSPSENGLFPWLLKTNSTGVSHCFYGTIAVTTRDTTAASNSYQLAEAAGPNIADMSFVGFDIIPVADSVECQPTGIDDLSFVPNSVSIYPNPIVTQSTLKYSLKTNETISVELRDFQGRFIQRFAEKEKKLLGTHEMQLSFSPGLASGQYVLVITTSRGQIGLNILKP